MFSFICGTHHHLEMVMVVIIMIVIMQHECKWGTVWWEIRSGGRNKYWVVKRIKVHSYIHMRTA
jgi:hypothetical protein